LSILDTFFIVFDSDVTSLNKGTDEANKKAEKLTNTLNIADLAGGKLGSSFGNLLATAGGAMMAIFSVGAMTSGIAGAIDYADKLNDLSNGLGVATEDLDSWGKAVKMSGGSAEEFHGTLAMVSADFAMIATKGTSRMLPFWKELGINLKDSHGKMREVMDVLPELADKFAGMSKQESIGMGKKLGLDQGTIMLLQQGRREVEAQIKQQKEMGVVTAEQAKQAGEFNDALDQLSMNFRGMFLNVGGSLIPAFKWMIDMFGKVASFFRKHSHFITGLFIALGAAVMIFLVPPLITAGIAALTAMAPFLLMGAAIALAAGAFALLYDDVMNFIDGNDSMIGSLSKSYPVIGDIVNGLVDIFRFFFDFTTNGFAHMGDVIMGIWDSIVKTIMEGIETAKGAMNGVLGFFGMDGMEVAHKVVGSASATPLNSTNSAAISNSRTSAKNTTVTVGKVEVKTKATDAAGIARSVGGHMKGELKRATSNYDDGILA